MVSYISVFYFTDEQGNQIASGIVSVDLPIDGVGQYLNAFDLGTSGYGELVTDEGTYIYSPQRRLVLNQEKIFDSEKLIDNGPILEAVEKGAIAVQQFTLDNGANSVMATNPIEGTNWRVEGKGK